MNNIPRSPFWCSYCKCPKSYGLTGFCSDHKNGDYNGPDVYEPTGWVLSVVGSKYRAYRDDLVVVWECVGYDPRHGFWMIDNNDGHERCISERAIDGTWHKVR
jgi:hypothetical protein